jgi:hypothetical protein
MAKYEAGQYVEKFKGINETPPICQAKNTFKYHVPYSLVQTFFNIQNNSKWRT